jgi:histidinol-phosphate aminotransferase
MSRFLSGRHKSLVPYTPGEQPTQRQYIKLNTNESPFPPSEKAVLFASEAARKLELYPDPTCGALHAAFAGRCGVEPHEVLMTNGSDEILYFAFLAFCDDRHPAAFADITYGFYSVFADLLHVPYTLIPLRDDFSIDPEDYVGLGKTIFLANPNAPTGLALSPDAVERIVRGNPNNVVVVDEAYVDFGAESAVGLIHKYDNLLVTQTFSKSRSMAGARLGCGIGCKDLIADLNTIKYSINPYNINRMTMAAGLGVLADEEYTRQNCRAVAETRTMTTEALRQLGFSVLDSKANFVFAKAGWIGGKDLYLKLKDRGVLIRHFETPRLKDYNRITIGSREQMRALLLAIEAIREELK